MTNNGSYQHSRSSERETQKENQATQSQERAQAEETGLIANSKEEERQQAELTRRVAGTVAPYVEPPSKIPRRRGRRVSGREIASGGESDG
jgi:hypothetical protein